MKTIKFILLCFVVAVMISSCSKLTPKKKIKTESDSASYALGINLGHWLKPQFEEIDVDIVAQAIKDVYADKKDLMFDQQTSGMFLQSYVNKATEKKAEKNLKDSEEFLEKNKKEDGVVTTASGLQYKVLVEGTGEKPKPEDMVKVHYTGTLIDGTVFDSSVERNQPAVFGVNRVITGWTEGLQLMKVGSKFKLYIHPSLAYGERGAGGKIGPNQALIFEVELLEIVKN